MSVGSWVALGVALAKEAFSAVKAISARRKPVTMDEHNRVMSDADAVRRRIDAAVAARFPKSDKPN